MRLPILLFLLASPLLSAVEPALRDGEVLVYRVGWGFFSHAGDIKISAKTVNDGPNNSPQLHVTTLTETKGLARAFYTFLARAEAVFDAKTGRLLTYEEMSKATNRETKNSVAFDYAKSTAAYTNGITPEKNTTLLVPTGDPADLIMSLVQTRTWNLKPGEKRDALVLFDDEFYELTIYADRYEEVHTPHGSINTLVLVPRMEKTPPKGMFKKGSVVSVWISQDDRKVPVKFQVDFRFGAGVATLSQYQPPSDTKIAESATESATGKPAAAESESHAKNPGP